MDKLAVTTCQLVSSLAIFASYGSLNSLKTYPGAAPFMQGNKGSTQ